MVPTNYPLSDINKEVTRLQQLKAALLTIPFSKRIFLSLNYTQVISFQIYKLIHNLIVKRACHSLWNFKIIVKRINIKFKNCMIITD